jgi:hypothetical protein
MMAGLVPAIGFSTTREILEADSSGGTLLSPPAYTAVLGTLFVFDPF